MPLIGIQAGHLNIASNVDPILKTETGYPGEVEFNTAVQKELSRILIGYGFQVQLDDANANSSPLTLGKDFDFYLAIHAEGAPIGGNVVAPDSSVDAANQESIRIVNAIITTYFTDTGIERDTITTPNERYYYMWNLLTAKTPCGIIECGDLGDAHDKVILADYRRIALGIAHGLCNAFGILWRGDPDINPAPPIPTPDPCSDIKKEFEDYKASHPDITPRENALLTFIKNLFG